VARANKTEFWFIVLPEWGLATLSKFEVNKAKFREISRARDEYEEARLTPLSKLPSPGSAGNGQGGQG